MKGADVVMSSIVQYNDWLDEEVSKEKKFICNMDFFFFLMYITFTFFIYMKQNNRVDFPFNKVFYLKKISIES